MHCSSRKDKHFCRQMKVYSGENFGPVEKQTVDTKQLRDTYSVFLLLSFLFFYFNFPSPVVNQLGLFIIYTCLKMLCLRTAAKVRQKIVTTTRIGTDLFLRIFARLLVRATFPPLWQTRIRKEEKMRQTTWVPGLRSSALILREKLCRCKGRRRWDFRFHVAKLNFSHLQ